MDKNRKEDLILEIYRGFLNMPDGTVYERIEDGALFRFTKEDYRLYCSVMWNTTSSNLYVKSIPFEYMTIRNTLDRLFSKDWQKVFDEIRSAGVTSNSRTYNYTIEHFNEYGLNISSKDDMLKLNNVMEAHGETLEDLGDYTSKAFDFECKDRADAAEWFLETNGFWDSWNDYAWFNVECENSIEDAKESLLFSLKHSNLVKTTDGIVECGIV